ncbi:hypothetical protein M1446_00515 [Candidatus Dependentiae bacterium]|nr:hypothetical protein [Candidatus Dependentiae bacterium]
MYKKLLLFLTIIPTFFVRPSGNSPKLSEKGSPRLIKEIEIFESDDKDFGEKIQSITKILELAKNDKAWVEKFYDEKNQNLPALLGFFAFLCANNNNELFLKVLFRGLKIFIKNLKERSEICDIFYKHVTEDSFVKDPVNKLIEFLWFFSFKLEEDEQEFNPKLFNRVAVFAHFINQDEKNLFQPSIIIFKEMCTKYISATYLNNNFNKLDKIFADTIADNHRVFKDFNSLIKIYLEFFIKLGANVNFCGHKNPSLVTAVKYDYLELAKFLIDKGVDVNHQCQNIHCEINPIAHYLESMKMLKLLIQNNVELDRNRKDGQTALFTLVKKLYWDNILKAENIEECKSKLEQYTGMIVALLNEKVQADDDLLQFAQYLLSSLDRVICNPEFRDMTVNEFGLKKLKSVISCYN